MYCFMPLVFTISSHMRQSNIDFNAGFELLTSVGVGSIGMNSKKLFKITTRTLLDHILLSCSGTIQYLYVDHSCEISPLTIGTIEVISQTITFVD